MSTNITAMALDGNRGLPYSRDGLGRMACEARVRWSQTQSYTKPEWIVPYDDLSEAEKEMYRQIGETVARWTLIGDAARLSAFDKFICDNVRIVTAPTQ